MKKLQFSIEINSSKEKVWNTLWQDKTFREWAGIIDPGTYIVGELKEGNEVQFISAEGYGVKSFVERLITNEYLLLKHLADTKESGREEREKEWTGGEESYRLVNNGTTTTLTVEFNVPLELEEYFKVNYPKALEKIKELAEES